MKKLIAISAFCFSLSAFATTVLFPLQLMTGNKHNRTILIQPDISTNQLVNGTNLVGLLPVTVTPTNGVGRAALLPWSYTVRVDGWPKSFHILVPESTNTLNAVDLITNTVAIGTPVQLLTSVAVSNSPTVTWTGNGTSTNPLSASVGGSPEFSELAARYITLGGTNGTDSTGYGGIIIKDESGVTIFEVDSDGRNITLKGWIYGENFVGNGNAITNIPPSNIVGGAITNSSESVNLGGLTLEQNAIKGPDYATVDFLNREISGPDWQFSYGLNANQLTGTMPVGVAPGITTNLQFKMSGYTTNTLYFTNGILMRVSAP